LEKLVENLTFLTCPHLEKDAGVKIEQVANAENKTKATPAGSP